MVGTSNPSSVPVIQIDLSGKYVSEFISINEAKSAINHKSGIRIYRMGEKICANKGHVFMLKEEYEKIKKSDGSVELPKFRNIVTGTRSIVKTKELIKVVQLDDLGNAIEIFDSYELAELKIGKRGVLDVCRKRTYTDKNGSTHKYLKCGGYKWMYYDDFLLHSMNLKS
jgi:hypothetical protein